MKKYLAMLLAGALSVSLLAGCGGSNASNSAASNAGSASNGSADQSSVIKIGGIGPLTGSAAVYGIATKTGAQGAVDEINALGGNIQNAYGISKEELKAAIPCGIGKINVDTDIRLAVTRNFRELFRDHPELKEDARVGGVWKLLDEKRDAFDPRAFLAPIMDTVMYGTGDEGAVALITDAMRRGVKEAVGTLIVEFGSYGKAPLVEPATLEDMAARYAKEG